MLGRVRLKKFILKAEFEGLIMTSIVTPKTATLAELHESLLYKKLQSSIDDALPLLEANGDASSFINSRFANNVLEIYGILHQGSFNRPDMAALEFSGLLSHILPFLSLERLPLVSGLGSEYEKIKRATIMTCVWAFVEESGGTEDVLSKIAKGKYM
ncbi:conserved hypothetical protein [Theileria equi strain WA]|uniref:Uncharacterized protein n=1 Tax=Theileria equi strain WA TaxID=1537102 RepID=L1LAL2_THEEQ|nr:conserved hypothetical protein [Theileria equi strain WA]EKX72356.1 conserved hypothetical protein [Theileria equi strain WA]|eukprot:XP_004831808.1 conserved hypothetical protein [Theileria equi strain WA]